jgi:hypothetical protein
MPRVLWPLRHGRPIVRIVLTLEAGGQRISRELLADTGAGSRRADLDLILEEDDCLLCGGTPLMPVVLGGAFQGSFPRYRIKVWLPELAFVKSLSVVAVPSTADGFAGIACFRFLNRFHYGNFSDPAKFGLEL